MVVQNEEVELMGEESDVEIEGSKLKLIESQLIVLKITLFRI